MFLAIERGEIDGRCGWAFSSIKITKPDWIAEKKVRFLNVLSVERSRELPDVPAIMEFAKTDRHKEIMRFVLNAQTLGRPVAAPPGIPTDRAAALRKAFADTMVDKALLAEMTARKLEVDYISADGVVKLLGGLYATPKELVSETRTIIAEE
jgi:tripartite-type tricarboxylate transporter receptor subunit TctC